MAAPRIVPLFDPSARPSSWNERMAPGEYAVLFANLVPPLDDVGEAPATGTPVCVIFDTLPAATAWATGLTEKHPRLRCSIFDERGMAGEPVRVVCGVDGRDTNEVSARFRRWGGGALLTVGVGLCVAEWVSGFTLSWAGIVGMRLAMVGLVLVLTELGVLLHAYDLRRRAQQGQ